MSVQTSVVCRLLLALAAIALMSTAVAQSSQPFSTLEERMTGREFREAGLHKLTDEELATLNRWILARSLAEGEAMPADEDAADARRPGAARGVSGDRRGFQDRADRSTIRSRIDGSFSGWSGNTQFRLENGMVWRQAESGTFYISEAQNQEVEIRPAALSTWRLHVPGYGSSIRVERVE